MFVIEMRKPDCSAVYFKSSTSMPTADIRLAKFFKTVGLTRMHVTTCTGWCEYNYFKCQGYTVHVVEVDLDVTVVGDV